MTSQERNERLRTRAYADNDACPPEETRRIEAIGREVLAQHCGCRPRPPWYVRLWRLLRRGR